MGIGVQDQGGQGMEAKSVLAIRSVNITRLGDAELEKLSREGHLFLSLDEMKAIQAEYRRLGREPREIELETLAQTWSEHCKHKIFSARIEYEDEQGNQEVINSLFKSYIMQVTADVRKARGKDDICLSVFKDNAGVIKFNDD